MIPRVVPVLLLKRGGLYKTRKFANEKYVGDPVNAVRIFNEKEVDELAVVDMGAARGASGPNFDVLRDIASEAFMPMSYGGGVSDCETVHELVTLGYERVIVNSAAVRDPKLVGDIAARFGTSTLIASIDARKDVLGRYHVYVNGGQEKTKLLAADWARELAHLGAGEILLTSIDRDGEMTGYDLALVRQVASGLGVPVIALGGAGKSQDFVDAVDAGASAVAAGAYFVFHGKHRAVLISYPPRRELEALWPERAADGTPRDL
jgi:cyclase